MQRSPRRHVLVGLAGGLAIVAGCVGESDDGDDETDDKGADDNTGDDEMGSDDGDDIGNPNGGTDEEPIDPVAAVIEETKDAVVSIGGDTLAAGVVVDSQHVLTTQHVLGSEESVAVTFSDETQRTGTVAGTDVHNNLATLSVSDVPQSATPLGFVSRSLVGEEVLIFHDQFPDPESPQTAVIAAADGTATAPTGFTIPATVETDPPVEASLSGVPIVTLDGSLAGISSRGSDRDFAISPALINRSLPELLAGNSVEHPGLDALFMAVPTGDDAPPGVPDEPGAMVIATVSGGPADEANLRPAADSPVNDPAELDRAGDVIVAIEGKPVDAPDDLRRYLALEAEPDDTVELTLVRAGDTMTRSVPLGVRRDVPLADADVSFVDPVLVPHRGGYDPASPPVDGFAHLWSPGDRDSPFVDRIGEADFTVGSDSVTPGASGVFGDDAVRYDESGYLIYRGDVDIETDESFSMGAWISHAQTGDYGAVLLLQNEDDGEALGIGVNAGRDVNRPYPKVLSVDRTNGWGSTGYSNGQWHLHVLRYDADSGTAELWFDGELDYEVAVDNADGWVPALADGEIVSGFRPVASRDYPFAGRIAWPWVAQGLIDPADIQLLYTIGADSKQ